MTAPSTATPPAEAPAQPGVLPSSPPAIMPDTPPGSPHDAPAGLPHVTPGAPLGILLRSGGHDAAHYALVAATAAAAIGRNVVLFATNEGCQLLLRTSPLLADPREALLASRGVATLATLREAALELGIRHIACEAGLRAEAIPADALAPGVETAGIVTFLAAVGSGQLLAL
jgi:predicted peroxiredoxin